jgi:hypothetical protein
VEAADNQLKALEKKLEVDHKLTLNMFQEIQIQLHKLRRQVIWVMVAAAVAFALVAVIGAVLIRDV